MQELIFSDVRCFRGDFNVRLAPITLLVGENSTGKSTLLALARLAWDLVFSRAQLNFNEPPFMLGVFNDIAHKHGRQKADDQSFKIGTSLPLSERRMSEIPGLETNLLSLVGHFCNANGQPALHALSATARPWSITCKYMGSGWRWEVKTPSTAWAETIEGYSLPVWPFDFNALSFLARELYEMHPGDGAGPDPVPPHKEVLALSNLVAGLGNIDRETLQLPYFGRPRAIAPVRSQPQRTYDPLTESHSPYGDHVPSLLARLSADEEGAWDQLSKAINQFGKDSGLFESLAVRQYGRAEAGAPFKLLARPPGQRQGFSVVDLGYGLSQVLPVIVDSLLAPSTSTLLIQQPEIHLHPRAQAALGTFLATMATKKKLRFLVETHSDFLVDRVRKAIRDKQLSREQVSLLYFSRKKNASEISEIELDSTGTPVSSPRKYRDFFLREQLELLRPKS